jgi:hypothetical protein
MKNYLKTFENFEVKDIQPVNEALLESGEAVNEGLFDKLTSMFSKFIPMFKETEKLKKATTTTVTQAGSKALKFTLEPETSLITQFAVKGDAFFSS